MVPMYTAECYWPGVTEAKLQQAAARAMQAAEAVAQQGVRVRYLGAVLFPDDQVVLFEFDSASADAVQRVSERAELDVARIVASLRIQDQSSRRPVEGAPGRPGIGAGLLVRDRLPFSMGTAETSNGPDETEEGP
jgi:hypothetical protein